MHNFSIIKTFASGKNEKLVIQSLKDVGFPSGKVSDQISYNFY